MQCEDNSKLRIPLSEVCKTTDIGCVPITNGKPTCTPQPDELPIAFDPSSTTLWLFSCKTHDWVAFQKFKLDQLSKMNLDNIRNICEVLNIAVWYDSGSAHVQGTVTLAQFGEELLKCIQLKTKTLIVERDTVKVWIDGLDKLPPYFVKGNNIWFEGGTGAETDPLRVATHDPICKWPVKSQAQVDAANVKHLGACLDGQMSRVPFPPDVCELPSKSEAQVRASANKQMIACIDGEGAKVPFPKEVCELDGLSQEQVDASTNKTLIACVNGKGAKIPYIESDPPICELPLVTTSQVSSAGNNATLALCLNGKSSRMPVPSGMFVPEYICVPKVTAKPTSPPDFGTGPLRMGCDDELYVWLCEENRWQMVTLGHNKLPQLDINDVADPCNNLKFFGWYRAGSEECNQNRYVTLCQLAEILQNTDIFNSVVGQIATEAANICKLPTRTAAQITQADNNASVPVCVDGTNARTTVSNLATVLAGNSNLVNTVTNSGTFGTKVNEIVKSNVTSNTNNITTTITEKVIESSNLNTKVNNIVKNSVNNNTSNLATSIIDKVVASGRVQNPICSLTSTNKSNLESNWSNATVPVCENGVSKKIGINTFTNVILSKYVPPDPDLDCDLPFKIQNYSVIGAGGINPETNAQVGRQMDFSNITLVPSGSTGVNFAIYRSSTRSFIRGSGTMTSNVDQTRIDNGVGEIPIIIKNNSATCKAYVEINTSVFMTKKNRDQDFSVTIFARPSTTSHESYFDAIGLEIGNPNSSGNFWNQHAVAGYHTQDKLVYGGSWDYTGNWNSASYLPLNSTNPLPTTFTLSKGQTINYYLQFFIVFASTSLTNISSFNGAFYSATASVKVYRGVYI